MNIEIRLFATLRMGRFKKESRTYQEMTPGEVLDELNIPEEDVAILLINGRDGLMDTSLKDGDVLSVFPPVGGG